MVDPSRTCDMTHNCQPATELASPAMTAHSVSVSKDTRLATILGSGSHDVNSFHGQAVDRVGDGLNVVARSDGGLIEALEMTGDMFVSVPSGTPKSRPSKPPSSHGSWTQLGNTSGQADRAATPLALRAMCFR